MRTRSQAGAATVEHAGLVALIALLAGAAIAAWRPARIRAGAARIDAGPQAPLRRGRPRAVLARPADARLRTAARRRRPGARAGAGRPAPAAAGRLPLLPLGELRDARPRPRPTASDRRVTAFVAVDDRRRSAGVAEITYWLYRPTLGWEPSPRGDRRRRRPGLHAAARRRGPGAGRAGDPRRPQPVRLARGRRPAVALAGRVRVPVKSAHSKRASPGRVVGAMRT